MTGIAVFGSSEPRSGSALYEQARQVGAGLARAGYEVLTGGYGGVMEGASRGAIEAGGRTLGVTCSLFDHRGANAYLSREISTDDLFERTRKLIEAAEGYVILAGKAGTLAELTFVWALHRAGCLGPHPVILLGDAWPEWVETLRRHGMIDPAQLQITQTVDTAEEAVARLLDRIDP